LIDIAPTVLDLFGVEVPSVMQGRPLFGGRMRTPAAPPAPSRSLDPEQVAR
jgi:arylsulfatase A-like enzyme